MVFAMTTKRTFSLPDDTLEQFEALVPKSKRSRFVNAALISALQQKAKEQALLALEQMSKPAITGEDIVKTIQQNRQESADRL